MLTQHNTKIRWLYGSNALNSVYSSCSKCPSSDWNLRFLGLQTDRISWGFEKFDYPLFNFYSYKKNVRIHLQQKIIHNILLHDKDLSVMWKKISQNKWTNIVPERFNAEIALVENCVLSTASRAIDMKSVIYLGYWTIPGIDVVYWNYFLCPSIIRKWPKTIR